MDRVELHDVEYGDCTVLVGQNRQILMVDCGSVNRYARCGDEEIEHRFDTIFNRYTPAAQRQFLLTHYHRDHMSGFLRQVKKDPGYFDRVYIPALPLDRSGTDPILEFAVFAHFFSVPQSDFAQVNTTCLRIFDLLNGTIGADRIFTLGGGDLFSFDNQFYEVLTPARDDPFPFDERLTEAVKSMNDYLLSPLCTGHETEFSEAKDAFIRVYHQCQSAFAPLNRETVMCRRALLDSLHALLQKLETLRADMQFSPAVPDIQDILNRAAVRNLYTETQNDLSLVFHNRRSGASNLDILMTGDVSDAVLCRIAGKLYDGYYAIKAPHHGTESHFSGVIHDLAAAHLLISNGDYHAGGEISQRYIDMESIKHCTNAGACRWRDAAGGCCNRLQRCYEQPASGALTLKCFAAGGECRTPCNIYVFGHSGVSGCHCDRERR